MRDRAINTLLNMGMPADIKGFTYIVDAMCLFEDAKWRTGKTTVLYSEIGKRYNTTASRVERNIRHAFEIVVAKGDQDMVKKYLLLQRLTNGNLLHTLYLRLVQEGEKDAD